MSSFRSRSGGNLILGNVQPEIQILTKPFACHFMIQVAVSRSDYSDVYRHAAPAAERINFLVSITRRILAWA